MNLHAKRRVLKAKRMECRETCLKCKEEDLAGIEKSLRDRWKYREEGLGHTEGI